MGKKRDQSQCKECEYIWYPRERKEPCPKCKSTRVSHTSALGRLVLMLFLLGLVGGAVFAGFHFKDRIFGGDAGDGSEEVAKPEERRPVADPPEPVEQPASLDLPKLQPEAESPDSPEPLTGQRTWTAKNGRALQASLLRLSLVEGQYVGDFEKPNGETFQYKIGNLSPADVDLVKGIVAEK